RRAPDEARVGAGADVVFAPSRALAAAKVRLNPETHLARHGVDHGHFARATDAATPVAPEIAALPRPVLGLVGLIDERIDLGLLATVAARRPAWTFVLV